MERQYNIETKARVEEVRELLLKRGYERFEKLGQESYERRDIGIFLDLRIPTSDDISEYRGISPKGIKFPKAHLATDIVSCRIRREKENEDLETFSEIISNEMTKILEQLQAEHMSEMYVFKCPYKRAEAIINDMKRALEK